MLTVREAKGMVYMGINKFTHMNLPDNHEIWMVEILYGIFFGSAKIHSLSLSWKHLKCKSMIVKNKKNQLLK